MDQDVVARAEQILGHRFADRSLIMGAPAKAVREISPEQAQRMARGAAYYVDNARRHRDGLQRVDRPLPGAGA